MSCFSFDLPECEPGDVLSIQAPDGTPLQIPVPHGVGPGDTLQVGKGPDGEWGITDLGRGGGAPSPASCEAQMRWRSAQEMAADCRGSEAVTVRLDTTKGALFIDVVPAWSPLGAQRFLQLVKDGYYDDIAIYRAIQGGLLQFGIVKDTDPRSSRYAKFADDPLVGIPYAEGVVSFAAAGPGTRKSTVCIMKSDFRTQLGKGALGSLSTETPFGMVCPDSMEVMHSIACLGDIPQCGGKGPDPGKLETMGNDYIRRGFPHCDFITGACIARAPVPNKPPASIAQQPKGATRNANPTAIFNTSMGYFEAEIYLDRVPRTASNFIDLAKTGFYDRVHFHRVIPNFMNQFGCPHAKDPNDPRAGTGGPPDGTFVNLRSGRKEQRFNGGRIEDEHVSRDSNMAGTLSMANSGKPHTGGSQFFLNVADNTFLDWFGSGDSQHPVFGAIVSGYDVVVAISKVRTKKECPVHPVMVHGIMMSGL